MHTLLYLEAVCIDVWQQLLGGKDVSVCGCTYEFVTTECNIVVNQTTVSTLETLLLKDTLLCLCGTAQLLWIC